MGECHSKSSKTYKSGGRSARGDTNTADIKFSRKNIPIMRYEKKTDSYELIETRGYTADISGEKVNIQKSPIGFGYYINLYGVLASQMIDTLSEAKQQAREIIKEFKKNPERIQDLKRAKAEYSEIIKSGGNMSKSDMQAFRKRMRQNATK